MTKLKVLIGGIFLTILSGCSEDGDSFEVNTTSWGVTTSCIEGVVYYSSVKRLAVAFNKDGTIKACEENTDENQN